MSEGFVYCLVSSKGATYIGSTIDLDHRLRQHNGIIKGGAVATTSRVKQGETWKRHCYVRNFPDWQACLQFEWRWKQLTRKLGSNSKPIDRRMKALEQLLAMERPTEKAMNYCDWLLPPEIIYEKN